MRQLSASYLRGSGPWTSFLLIHILLLTICLADPKSQDTSSCTLTQFACRCGEPKCIEKTLVKDGRKDCADGSDETDNKGEWDPSKCAIKNRTSEDIRFKRAAIPDFGETATTTFFTHDRARTRPVGLLQTSVGAFVTSGTTTEYLTKVIGTYIKGTYARIISTTSKVYHALATQGVGADQRPTGFITSTKSTEINGYATTIHNVNFLRDYVDGTYIQIVSSSSSVQFPNWYTDKIEPTQAYENVYSTFTPFPKDVKGSFVNVEQSKAYAELGIKALRPNNNEENELQVKGTHGKFVHSDTVKGEETTFNVFTGSYVENLKTYLFFFGNVAIDPTKAVSGESKPTLMVESGNGKGVKVNMGSKLKVVVPSANSRVKVDGSVGGVEMQGVVVEIEGSEDIRVDGAQEMGTPSIDTMTMTLNKGNTRVSTSSSSSSSSRQTTEEENEIPRARKVPDQEIAPSRTEKQFLPTFTVGQPDAVELEEEQEVVTTPKGVETTTKSRVSGNGAPVFQKKIATTTPRSNDRIRALGYTQQQQKKSGNISNANLNGKYPMPNRNHRAFSGFDAMANMNDVEGDLQSAASTGRATVTYVGFADFTTTVGNTVIVFMPRTKMIEDLSVHASKTVEPSSVQVEPTRFVYHTSDETTTEANDDEHVQFSVSQVQGRKVGKNIGSSVKVTIKDDGDDEGTTEANPTEFVSSISGRKTILIGQKSSSVQKPKVRPSVSGNSSSDKRSSLFSSPRVKFTPGSKVSSSSPVFNRKSATSVYQTASTKVFQTDVLNPTGLVTSIDGTLVKEGTTTLYTSLVYGTFIGKSYAQVIKSSSQVVTDQVSLAPVPATKSAIRPTSVAKLPVYKSKSSSVAPVYYEFSTTTQSGDDEGESETTTLANKDLDRMEVSVSSTTEKSKEEEAQTTLDPSYDEDDIITTTTERELAQDNEIRRRKVEGKAKDQTIVDLEPSIDSVTPEGEDNEEEKTVYVTRTLPTTISRIFTYYTTFFNEKSTKIVSREVTSTAVGLVKKTLTSIIPAASAGVEQEVKATDEVKPGKRFRGKDNGAQIIYKTLRTTFTYLTTHYFGHSSSSVSSREETVTNIITSSVGRTASEEITPTSTSTKSLRSRGYKTVTSRLSNAPQGGLSNVGASSSSSLRKGARSSIIRRPKLTSAASVADVDVDSKATDEIEYQSVTKTLLRTYYTTYTYLTTYLLNSNSDSESSSIKSQTKVITNVVPYVTKTLVPIEPSTTATNSASVNEYEDEYEEDIKTSVQPSKLSGRSAGKSKATKSASVNEVDSEEEVEKATTSQPQSEYELEGSEDVGVTTNIPHNYEDDNDVLANEKTPVLRTIYTTLTYYTTYHQGSKSSVTSRFETKSHVVTGTSALDEAEEPTITDKAALLSVPYTSVDQQPITYFTTFTYWTTSFGPSGSSVITSSKKTVSNVVTPGVDDIAPSSTSSDNNEILPTSSQEIEYTTFYTTYTYFTTSYLQDKTIINSRLETVTNIVTGTPALLSPTQTGRAIGTVKPDEQKISGNEKDEYEDYATGLLSTIVSTEVKDGTTTLHRTDVFGSVIDGIYAQILESTSEVIQPTVSAFTRFFPDATETVTGVVSVNEGQIVEADKGKTTFYATTAYGTVIDGHGYAHLIQSTSSVKTDPSRALETSYDDYETQKTGLVRVIDGTLVEGDKTILYTSSILGSFVDGQYEQVIESTSRFIVNPTKVEELGSSKSVVVDVESSVTESSSSDEEGVTTTTEKEADEVTEKAKISGGIVPPRRFGGNRDRSSSRLSFTSTAKTFTPAITPFASRSRPSGFVPKKRTSIGISASKTEDASSPSTSSTSTRGGFQAKRRFQKPTEVAGDATTTPTPALPASRVRGSSGRFSKPAVGFKSRFEKTSSAVISPSSVSGSAGGSSPGARGRSSFAPRGSSVAGGGRSRSTAPLAAVQGSSTAGFRPGPSSSSRFFPGRGRSSSINATPTQATSVTPTEVSSLAPEEYEEEYENNENVSSSTTTTTEAPRNNRFGSNNRFRLSQKLSTPGPKTTTSRPITTRGSPLNLRRFSKPTIATRGTTPAASTSTETSDTASSSQATNNEEYESEYEEVPSSSTTTTTKPLKSGFKKPIQSRPTSRPGTSRSNNRLTTTNAPVVAQTTPRRIYTPRPRPAGFPKALNPLARTTSTTPSPANADDEYYEDGEFEYQESKNVPNTTVLVEPSAAGSELSEVKVEAPKSLGQFLEENSDFLDSIFKALPLEEDDSSSQSSSRRRRRSTSRQVSPKEYAYLIHSNYGERTARGTLRSNFPTRASSSNSNLKSNSRLPSGQSDYEYEYEYVDEPPAPPPTTAAPVRQSPSSRFRGRIQPTTSSSTPRRTPFTLTPNSNSRTTPTRTRGSSTISRPTSSSSPSRPFIPTRGRSKSRYRPSDPPTTTSRSSRFKSRYNSRDSLINTTPAPSTNTRGASRFGSALTRTRSGSLPVVNNNELPFEPTTITVTHYIPAETQIPFVNGKSTEYKTVLTPSPSVQVLSPFQYTQSDYLGKSVLVINGESTSMPSLGVTEVTRFLIRESPTTSVTFTPTTIRGRKTSFSHIVPSTVYSIENLVSTVTGLVNNPVHDNNQLTNLLLNQLLGQGLLNPANLLALQQGQGSFLPNVNEPATPITQYTTKTTSYITTVTDFTSTVVKITLHGKPLKSTIVESSINVITATEFITESNVITPSPPPPQIQPFSQQLQPQPQNLLLQNLLQQQLQAQLLQQNNPIIPTPAPLLPQAQLNTQQTGNKEQFNQEEESTNTNKPDPPKAPTPPASTVVTRYVSGKNPGEFSTVLQTVAVTASRRKRDVVLPTQSLASYDTANAIFDTPTDNRNYYETTVQLEDSYSYSDPFGGVGLGVTSRGDRATDTLESALGQFSSFSELPL